VQQTDLREQSSGSKKHGKQECLHRTLANRIEIARQPGIVRDDYAEEKCAE
jgi:hypothetical protein